MLHSSMFCCLCCCCLIGVFGSDEVKSVSVTEGESVTLHSDLAEIKSDHLIFWNFETNKTHIVTIHGNTREIVKNEALEDEFRERLNVNQTGSLTITDIRPTDSGLYKLSISGSNTEAEIRFNVTVYARLPVPVIIRDYSSFPSSSSYCSVLCSVVNVSTVSLSWYKGNLLSSISVSDLNNSVSLHLECLDDSYSCVVNNSFTNQTTHLSNTELCQPCPECTFCCHVSEAVTRLVFSTVVGMATAFVLVYDIKSRKICGQKVRTSSSSSSVSHR